MTKPEGPAQEPQIHPLIYGCLDCGTMSKLQPWQKVRCSERSCQSDNVRHLRTQADIDSFVPATPAPSQPVGAREAAKVVFDQLDQYIIEFNTIEPQMNDAALPVIQEAMEAYARQQTAAKDAELKLVSAELYKTKIAHSEANARWMAAERERDSLREALVTYGQHRNMCRRGNACDCGLNAALKAGKE